MERMRFKDFTWPKNPAVLKVSFEDHLEEMILPYAGARFQNLGRKKQVVSGEGVFTGPSAQEQFHRLWELQKQTDSGLLFLPDLPGMYAFFSKLEWIGETTPHVLRYAFVFWEDLSRGQVQEDPVSGRFYTASAGECLWDIANQYHQSLEDLLAKNPQIQWPNALREGDRVMLS